MNYLEFIKKYKKEEIKKKVYAIKDAIVNLVKTIIDTIIDYFKKYLGD